MAWDAEDEIIRDTLQYFEVLKHMRGDTCTLPLNDDRPRNIHNRARTKSRRPHLHHLTRQPPPAPQHTRSRDPQRTRIEHGRHRLQSPNDEIRAVQSEIDERARGQHAWAGAECAQAGAEVWIEGGGALVGLVFGVGAEVERAVEVVECFGVEGFGDEGCGWERGAREEGEDCGDWFDWQLGSSELGWW